MLVLAADATLDLFFGTRWPGKAAERDAGGEGGCRLFHYARVGGAAYAAGFVRPSSMTTGTLCAAVRRCRVTVQQQHPANGT